MREEKAINAYCIDQAVQLQAEAHFTHTLDGIVKDWKIETRAPDLYPEI